MGITGIFTKTLDVALVKGTIDIAVHSSKDVPTQMPKGMIQAAILERASHKDILVYKSDFNPDEAMTVATGSLRRKSQWLNMYAHHEIVDIRGNVNTRLAKLQSHKNWNAAIFARAGLERIGILAQLKTGYGFEYSDLDSFIPAPAQGAMMIAAMEKETAVVDAVRQLNHEPTQWCVDIERQFLRALEGGCTAPIGALAQLHGDEIHFTGCLLSIDGKERIEVTSTVAVDRIKDDVDFAFAKAQSQYILDHNGHELMKEIKSQLN